MMEETPCFNCLRLVKVVNESGDLIEYRCRAINEELDRGIAEGTDVEDLPSCGYFKTGTPAVIQISPQILNPSSHSESAPPPRKYKKRRKNAKPVRWNLTQVESWAELIEIITEYKTSSNTPPTPSEIIKASRYSAKSRAYVYQLLGRMEEAGLVRRVEVERTSVGQRYSRVAYDLV